MCATVRAAASPNWISATGPQPFGSERTSRKLPRCRLGALAACRAALYQPADADVAYVVQDPHARFSTSQKRWGRRCLALAAACSPRPTALHTYRMSGRLRRMRGPAAAKGTDGRRTADAYLLELEEERDAALATAESAAMSAVKLTEMVSLLEKLALRKLREGEEEAAKTVLQEKKSTSDAQNKMSAKASSNYALAAKLAQKIGETQRAMFDEDMPTDAKPTPAPSATSAASSPLGGSAAPRSSGSSTSDLSSTIPSGSGSASAAASERTSGYTGYDSTPKWQQSMEESRARRQAAAAADPWNSAQSSVEESIAAAQARLKARVSEDILSAQARCVRMR
uniref:Uncharacterized protein n=1 Tax=Chlamydomonas euryale TaxID=1486919 RepID=A0A7R9YRR0_9CHLO